MDASTRAETRQASKYCYECGKSDLVVSFRTELARRCDVCHERRQLEHQAFQRVYSKARYAATQRLIDAYEDDYKALLEEELDARRGPDGSLVLDVQGESEEEEYEKAS